MPPEPYERLSSGAGAFVRETRGGKGECSVCRREFDSVAEATAHVHGLMSAGAFGDHIQIHAGEPRYPAFTSLARRPGAGPSPQTEAPDARSRSRGWRFW